MASHWDRIGPHRHSQQDASLDNQSAYHATNNSYPSSDRPRNLPVPSDSPQEEISPRRKKATSLRSLIRRRPSEGRDSHSTHGRSQSLSPQSQTQPELSRRAPPSVPYNPPNPQRTLTHPPALTRSVSAHQPSMTSYQPYMPTYTSQQPTAWDSSLSSRAAQAYTASPWEARSSNPRAHSYYDPSSTNSSASASQYNYQAYRPPMPPRSHSNLSDGLDNPADFHLFVEATSGLSDSNSPFSLASPQSPPNPRPNFSIARRPPPPTLQTSFPARSPPPPPSTLLEPPVQPMQPPGPRTPSQILADQIQSISGDEDEDEELPPDSELPDYAQSQAEESARRRREAAMRAAELERRWAAARRSNR